MPIPALDLKSLTIEEKLRLIDELWQSIQEAAVKGEGDAVQLLDRWEQLNPDVLDEMEREADEAEAHPEGLTSWDDLLVELKRKYG
jgi:hypothetical protein